jgi:hypothetical protein
MTAGSTSPRPQFVDKPVMIDPPTSFEQALNQIARERPLKVLDERTIMIIPDPQKRTRTRSR